MAAQIFGLDIGTALIKVVEMRGDVAHRELVAAGMADAPVGGLKNDSDDDIKRVAESVRHLVKSSKISTEYVVASLPESQIFTRVIDMPVLTDSELAQAIKYESEQYIPIPLSEVKLDYAVLHRPEGPGMNQKMQVLLVAAPVVLINRYLKMISHAGLKPYALDTEVTANARSLIKVRANVPTTMMVEIGASTTAISVVTNNKVSFTRSLAVGGNAFSRAVAQDLGFDVGQAEQYKNTYGLDESQLEGKIAVAIRPIFDVVSNEMRRALAFWSGRHSDNPVRRFVVSGGSAKMLGIIPYLTSATGLEGQQGQTWEGVSASSEIAQAVRDDGPFYSVAAGLAIRDMLRD
jgi:type IV pilus assembly protein PilM